MTLKRSLLFHLLLLSAIVGQAQQERIFSAAQIREDFQFLKASFDKYNPAIGIFHDKADFQAAYEKLYKELEGEMSDLAFYPYLVSLAEATREGHTSIGSTTDTVSTIFKGFFTGQFKYLPISIKYLDGKARVWVNLGPDSSLQRGDQILRINGEEVDSIIEKLKKFAITDGNIPSAKLSKLSSSFASYYFWFIDKPPSFQLTYRTYQTNETKKINILAINRDSMIAWRNRRYGKFEPKEESISDVYEFRVEGKTATLILKTFNRQIKDRFKIKPKKLYKDIFRTLKEKEVEHLILDMRDNTGGRREYAWNLLPYLLKKQQNGVVYKNVSWKGKESKNSFPKKSKWAFEGQIYVLTNANTFSNGSVVSVYAKEYGKAIVIGEETGSRYEGFAAGSTQYVTLPHTKIRVGIPRYLFKTMQSSSRQQLKNRGVIPDYPINYTMEDLIQKRDKAMEMAKSLIKENLNRQTSEN